MAGFAGNVKPDEQVISIEDGKIVVRFPIPPEQLLLEMLYHSGKGIPVGMVLQLDFEQKFVEDMLDKRHSDDPTWTRLAE